MKQTLSRRRWHHTGSFTGLCGSTLGLVTALLLGSACRTEPRSRDRSPPSSIQETVGETDAHQARGSRRPDAKRPRARGPVPRLRDVRPVPGVKPGYQRPRFTPDGKRISVTRRRFSGIFLVDPRSGAVEVVTRDPGAGYLYHFSSNHRRVAYRASKIVEGRPLHAVAVYDLTKRRGQVLTAFERNVGYPFFSRDGQHVLFTASSKLRRVAVRGGPPQTVASQVPARHLQWLPGGTRLLADEDQAVVAMAPDGTGRRRHFQGPGFFGPVVSTDRPYYLVHESRGRIGHLWLYDLKRHRRRDLGVGYSGVFLPGSHWIICQRNENDGRRYTAGDLYAVTLDGRARSRLTRTRSRIEQDPTLSPDGKRLAFVDAKTGFLFLARVEVR